ncbi:MAG: A/G-specific adenine glycosylase [Bacteroidetes bacterium]|nr:A/G-specific adenine glycosylase [Bacteroidota bacterium]
MTSQKLFSSKLLCWHNNENKRILPWKKETDPYKIWLSEILLQQTRAAQAIPYYLNFINNYPTIFDLAKANDDDVFRLWQGLGYYNRCKNMLWTARFICTHNKGQFPTKHEDILALKGVGTYTAAAIASFAFGLPYAVVDGNVTRVLARYFGISESISTTLGKKSFAELAQKLLPKKSADYNQAIMDFGAEICTPSAPKCASCPFQIECVAFQTKTINLLPVKAKNKVRKTRYFHFVILKNEEGKIWLQERTSKDIWPHLFVPFLLETQELLTSSELSKSIPLSKRKTLNLKFIGSEKQLLTHQQIISHFFELNFKNQLTLPPDGIWVKKEKLRNYPFPKTIISFFEKSLYF